MGVNMIQRILLSFAMSSFLTNIALALPAFPGAEGFGANAVGGRGGAIIEVTNLNDSGTGSLRACVEASMPRTCVFRTGGTIVVKSQLLVTKPYLTIAGQTAPGGGIALRSDPSYPKTLLMIAAHDVIVRHLRVRPGRVDPELVVSSQQGIQIGNGATEVYNVILDHVSVTWGIDGNVQTASTVHDVTIQNSIISEGLNNAGHEKGPHSRAMNFYVGENNYDRNGYMSLHHNLMSHVQFRVPQISTKNGKVEVINNVVYHTTQMAMNINCTAHNILGDSKTRFINNYLLRVATPNGKSDINLSSGCLDGTRVHTKGNIGPTRFLDSFADDLSINADDKYRWSDDPTLAGTFPFPSLRVTEDSAKIALEKISGTGAFAGKQTIGATVPKRDAVDERIIRQLTNYMTNSSGPTTPIPNGGLLDNPADVGGYPELDIGTPPVDTDHDGMPDVYETAINLNPRDASDGPRDQDADGYTNVEEYFNSLAGSDNNPPPPPPPQPTPTPTPTCVHANPEIKFANTNQSATAGTRLTFALTLKNNDSSNCSASTFTLDKVMPVGFSGSLSVSSITLNPAEITNLAIDVTSASSALAGSYPFTVKADSRENPTFRSTAMATYTVTALVPPPPPPPAETITIPVTEDASILKNYIDKNYGNSLELNADASPVKQFLLKFNVAGIGSKTIKSVKLRLYNTDKSDFGGKFFFVRNNNWSEKTVTFKNAPDSQDDILGSIGAVTENNWYELDLTALIKSDAVYSLRCRSSSENGASFASKEKGVIYAPHLVISFK